MVPEQEKPFWRKASLQPWLVSCLAADSLCLPEGDVPQHPAEAGHHSGHAPATHCPASGHERNLPSKGSLFLPFSSLFDVSSLPLGEGWSRTRAAFFHPLYEMATSPLTLEQSLSCLGSWLPLLVAALTLGACRPYANYSSSSTKMTASIFWAGTAAGTPEGAWLQAACCCWVPTAVGVRGCAASRARLLPARSCFRRGCSLCNVLLGAPEQRMGSQRPVTGCSRIALDSAGGREQQY